MTKRLLAGALCAVLASQAPAQAFAQASAAAASTAQGLGVPVAPLQLSPLSLGSAGGLGAAAPSLSLQGALPGLKAPEVRPSVPAASAASAVLASPTHQEAAAAPVIPRTQASASAPALPAARMEAAAAAKPAAQPQVQPRQAAAEHARALSKAAAPALESIRDASASASSQYAAGHKLADILSGQKSRSAADESDPPQAAAAPALSRSGLAQAGRAAAQAPAAETPAPELTAAQKLNFERYKVGNAAVKFGIEALNLAVPLLVLTQFSNATLVGAMFIGSDLLGTLAGWLAGPWIDRIKPSKVLAATALAQTAVIGAIPALFALGITLPFPVFFGLFVLNGALTGVFDIARRAQMPHIVGSDQGTLRSYGARAYISRELAATAGVFGLGLLASHVGYLPALWVFPAVYALATYLFLRLTLSNKAPPADASAQKPEAKDGPGGLSEFLRGARIALKDPQMRAAILVNLPLTAVHKLFHAIVATVYATKFLGNPAYAAIILGAWNIGELVGAWLLKKQGRSAHAFAWLKFSALAGLSGWAMLALPSIYVAVPVAFLLALAMIKGEIGLAAYFQSAVKPEDAGAVAGFVYPLATAFGMASIFAMGRVFDILGPQLGVLVIAAALTISSAVYLLSWRKLRDVKGSDAPVVFEDDD